MVRNNSNLRELEKMLDIKMKLELELRLIPGIIRNGVMMTFKIL